MRTAIPDLLRPCFKNYAEKNEQMPLIFTLFTAAVLAGCADSHQWAPQQNGSARIGTTDRILISTPVDGEYGAHVYNGSGRNTAKIIYNAATKNSR